MSERTTVHLLRHGEVHNPTGVLYGRLPGYPLSALGQQMSSRVAQALAERPIVHLVASPLERAQDTAAPLASLIGLDIVTDERVTEAASAFEGRPFAGGEGVFRSAKAWRHLWNPLRPSWGEPYREVVARMLPALADARRIAEGREAVIVSHQLPIWSTRLHLERRSLVHDPRRRQCSLCSLTSLTYAGDELVTVTYSEPAADLLPVKRHRRSASQRDGRGATR